MNTEKIAIKLEEQLKADGIKKPYQDNCDLNGYLLDVTKNEKEFWELSFQEQIPILNQILNHLL